MTEISTPHALSGRSWFITGLGVAQIASWGSLYYSFPLIAAAMEVELGWSKTAIYGASTVGVLLSALAAIPVGAAIDRGHGRWVMGGASALAGALMLLWSMADNLWLFYLVVTGIGALQAATLYEPAFAVIVRRTSSSGARNGITALTLWGGFASTIFVPLVQLLLDYYGWRQALLVLAGINAVVCAAIYLMVINPSLDAPKLTKPVADKPQRNLKTALQNPVFWWLAVSFTAYAASFSALLMHFYPMLIERGFNQHAVVATMALIGPSQVAGRVFVLAFGKQASGRLIGSVIVPAFPIAMAMYAWAPPEFLYIAAASMLYGAANGIMTIVRGIIIPELVSSEGYGAINGALVMPMTIARALAPLGAAALWSATGNYAGTMGAVVAAALLMTLTFWCATRSANSAKISTFSTNKNKQPS